MVWQPPSVVTRAVAAKMRTVARFKEAREEKTDDIAKPRRETWVA
jgi:hypothetical protein